MFNKLKQVKDMRDKAKQLQTLLADVAVEGTGAWGKVKVAMNGNQAVTSVTIDESLIVPAEKTKLENAIKDAMNDAQKKAQFKMVEKMRSSGDFKMPI